MTSEKRLRLLTYLPVLSVLLSLGVGIPTYFFLELYQLSETILIILLGLGVGIGFTLYAISGFYLGSIYALRGFRLVYIGKTRLYGEKARAESYKYLLFGIFILIHVGIIILLTV